MRSPFSNAADFFGRALSEQEQAADMQEYADNAYDSPTEYNLRMQSPTIGAVPPALVGRPSAEDAADNYVRGMKEELLEEARKRQRPTNDGAPMRASGGVNTAVTR